MLAGSAVWRQWRRPMPPTPLGGVAHLLAGVVDPSPPVAELLVGQVEAGGVRGRLVYGTRDLFQLHARTHGGAVVSIGDAHGGAGWHGKMLTGLP